MVYSTDKIYLTTMGTQTQEALARVELDDIKYPLSWSRNNEYIYVSEHLENIAMYRYKAEDLSVLNKQLHMGLSAFELKDGEIVSFDYLSQQFVSFNFDTETQVPLSIEITDHMKLSPNTAKVSNEGALLLFEDGRHKKVLEFKFSTKGTYSEPTVIAELLFVGEMQSFTNKNNGLVFRSIKNIQGDVQKLELIKE